jgi:hypothetical protein
MKVLSIISQAFGRGYDITSYFADVEVTDFFST